MALDSAAATASRHTGKTPKVRKLPKIMINLGVSAEEPANASNA